MSERITLGKVYDQLRASDHIGMPKNDTLPSFQHNEDNSPWYVQSLMGCGGWLATLFSFGIIGSFISLFLADLSDEQAGSVVWVAGILLAISTTVILRRNPNMGVFMQQVNLTAHLTGHLFLIVGFTLASNLYNTEIGVTILTLYAALVQVIFIWLYPNAIYRFLGMIAITISLWINLPLHQIALISTIMIGAWMALAIVIWLDLLPERLQIQQFELWRSLGYGLVVSVFGLIIYEITNRYMPAEDALRDTTILTTIVLFGCLIWVEAQLLSAYDINLTAAFALMVFGISALVALPTITTPGIIGGVIVILLAFRRRNWILLGIAYLYLAGFIVYYYFWLDVTLLMKSVILIITGLLLLGGRLLWQRYVLESIPAEGMSA
ncbi:MAG: DUF4401 domain-containing protein [Anaerolineae bacterium]